MLIAAADSIALVSAVAALVAGAITAATTSWLGGREKVAQELRESRLAVYPTVWERTSVLSRWPVTDLAYDGLERLHIDLRRWYYAIGGLYLSENARARYGELQTLVATQLATSGANASTPIPPGAYEALSESASSFRTALTEDLESRRQRSLVWAIGQSRRHRRQAVEAGRRLDAVRAEVPVTSGATLRYRLRPSDETLVDRTHRATGAAPLATTAGAAQPVEGT